MARVVLESPRVAPNPMEPRAALAWYDAERDTFELRVAHQGGFAMRDALAVMMNVAPEKIRVNLVDVGGAFGARTAPFSEYPLMLHMAKRLGRPIKWLSTRSEDFLTDNHGRAIRLEGELAFDASGRFIALRTNWLCDSGAYLTQAGAFTNSFNGMTIGASVYQVEALYGRHRQLMTNTAPTNAYRGAGRPEAVYIVERLVDAAAAMLGTDPLVLRRRNVIRRDPDAVQDPDRRGVRQRRFRRAHRQGRSRPRAGRALRSAGARRRGAARCAASAARCSWSRPAAAWCRRTRSPSASARTARSCSTAWPDRAGRGTRPCFPSWSRACSASIPAQVTLRAGDPDGPALIGSPAIGSRTILAHGSTYKRAAEQVIEKGRPFAADALETSVDDVEYP